MSAAVSASDEMNTRSKAFTQVIERFTTSVTLRLSPSPSATLSRSREKARGKGHRACQQWWPRQTVADFLSGSGFCETTVTVGTNETGISIEMPVQLVSKKLRATCWHGYCHRYHRRARNVHDNRSR